jgi:hypothetical protein
VGLEAFVEEDLDVKLTAVKKIEGLEANRERLASADAAEQPLGSRSPWSSTDLAQQPHDCASPQKIPTTAEQPLGSTSPRRKTASVEEIDSSLACCASPSAPTRIPPPLPEVDYRLEDLNTEAVNTTFDATIPTFEVTIPSPSNSATFHSPTNSSPSFYLPAIPSLSPSFNFFPNILDTSDDDRFAISVEDPFTQPLPLTSLSVQDVFQQLSIADADADPLVQIHKVQSVQLLLLLPGGKFLCLIDAV